MLAGASAVAVGTDNFYEPQTAVKVVEGIRTFLTAHKLSDVSQLVGRVDASRE